ncbi:MAG TPA: alpha/beta hydrolase [Anaerolineales bacterium]
MNQFESTLRTADGLPLFIQGWDPQDEPRAVVCLVHGLGEHSGRYTHLAEPLTRAGYALIALDLRGHGKSGGPRGHTPSFDALLDDIALLLQEAGKRYPDTARFLYGHSLGGLLVLNYVLRRKPMLAGVIATGAGLHSSLEEQTLKVSFAKMMGKVLPTVTLATGLDPKDICRDPRVVAAYQNDPLVHDRSTLAMAKYNFEAMPYALTHASEFHLPLLLMHGTADRLTYLSGSQEFADQVPGCTLKLWDGLCHEIHNEPEQDQVFAFLLDWLDARSPFPAHTSL